jgi:uncharacterized protein
LISIDTAREYYGGHDASHDFDHVLRVLRTAERIGLHEGADSVVLRAAVLLHDVGRQEERRSGACHADVGARLAGEILAGHPLDRVNAVVDAIATHRYRTKLVPQSLEAKILYDADKLDAIGAVGIARAYAIAGKMGQRLWGDVPSSYGERSRTDGRADELSAEHTPVHEFVYKLSNLKGTLFTTTARGIAEDRHAFMVSFFDRLGLEVDGQL